MNSLFALPGYYLIEESSPTSAGNLTWFIKQVIPELEDKVKADGESVYDLIDDSVESIPPEEFTPLFLPFLMASNVHPNAKGCLIGLSAAHTREHIARAIFEGVTFCHRYHYERLMKTGRPVPSVIRLAGGAARARVWAQMFADVMQVPVQTLGWAVRSRRRRQPGNTPLWTRRSPIWRPFRSRFSRICPERRFITRSTASIFRPLTVWTACGAICRN